MQTAGSVGSSGSLSASASSSASPTKAHDDAARKGQIQRVSTVAQNVIRALRGPITAEFMRNFDFGLVHELLKALATLLSSLRVEDRAVRVQLVEVRVPLPYFSCDR